MRMLRAVLPPTRLERDLALQCVISAFATGSFLTGTAVFFTQIVGLTGAQVGLGMSVAGAVTLLLTLPLGRLADLVGAKPLWVVTSAIEAALYFAWPFIGGFWSFVVMLSVLASVEAAARSGRNVYRIAVFPREVRVRANAYMRSARNVGYTLGAGAGGVALGIGTDEAIIAVPLLTAVLLLVNAVMVSRLPALPGRAEDAAENGTDDNAAAPAALKNRGFVTLALCNGVLSSNQVLLNVVVPLWLVERTRRAPPRAGLALRHEHGDGRAPAGACGPGLGDRGRVPAGGTPQRAVLRRVMRHHLGDPRDRRLGLDPADLDRSRDHHGGRTVAVRLRLGIHL